MYAPVPVIITLVILKDMFYRNYYKENILSYFTVVIERYFKFFTILIKIDIENYRYELSKENGNRDNNDSVFTIAPVSPVNKISIGCF